MPLSVEVIRTTEELHGLRPGWDDLLERCQSHTVFLTPEWLLTWWEVYGIGAKPFMVAVWKGTRLVGLLPAYLTGSGPDRKNGASRQLRLLGSTAVCSDHLDGLANVGCEAQVVAGWQTAIREHQTEWDSLQFADLDTEGLLYRALKDDSRSWGKRLAWTEREAETCPFITLPSSWEAYLASLSAKTRREIRHDRRVLINSTRMTVQAVTDASQLNKGMATFMNLHRMRRQSLGDQRSCFSDPRYERFHRLVSHRFAEREWLHLWFLLANGDPVAARCQFAYRGRIHDYLPGHDPGWDRYSVGLVLLSHCVEEAIRHGNGEVDLLRGAEAYKFRWTSQSRKQVTFTASRQFSGAWVRHSSRETTRCLKGTVKQILPVELVQKLRGMREAIQKSRTSVTQRRYVPFFPSTAMRDLLGPRWSGVKPFPIGHPRAHYYYFARNGIWHAIDLLGLTPNDEVLMPAYNNGMEVAPFQHRGIPLSFVPVDQRMALDLRDLEAKITSRTRMVYVIHYLGFPQPIEEIQALCKRRGLLLFEDCALAFGSRVNGRPLGSFGDVAVFCLAKFLPVPNGGVLVLNNPELRTAPPTLIPSRYSVISQLTTKLLDQVEAHGGPWMRRTRHFVTHTARRLAAMAGLKRVDAGLMQFLPDKVDWGMASISKRILERVDYEAMYRKRRENYRTLLEMVRDIRGVVPLNPHLPEGVCPLFLPVLVVDSQRVSEPLIHRRLSAGGF